MGVTILTGWHLVDFAIKSGKVNHSAAVLLFSLIDKWNSLHRPFMPISMTNRELMQRCHFGSHVSLDNAKKELAEAGLIKYEVSQKRFGSKYTILWGALAQGDDMVRNSTTTEE